MSNRAKPEQLFQIGIKGLIRNQDGLYLCLKSPERYFDVPGGRIAEGENIRETLEKELFEEIGLCAEDFKIIGTGHVLWTDKFIESHALLPRLFLIVYTCKLVGEKAIQLSHEHTKYSWETARDLYEKVDILQGIPFEEIFNT